MWSVSNEWMSIGLAHTHNLLNAHRDIWVFLKGTHFWRRQDPNCPFNLKHHSSPSHFYERHMCNNIRPKSPGCVPVYDGDRRSHNWAKTYLKLKFIYSEKATKIYEISTNYLSCKVRTFWETHKIWKNLPHGFDKSADLLSKRQNHREDFFKLCVLLKKSEL